MNIAPITPAFTGASVRYRINPNNTKTSAVQFLYNDVLKIARNYKVPANFSNKHIDIIIEDMKYQAELAKTIRKELRTSNISYRKVK
ncbi:MAG: hypothetical protein VZR09_01635 [Candidatus Gastranaerophilaceae bacterium]|jgi:hypothetical protein|nr:hypothetical protein [Candidatus Gastranaerophilaceae bacterium]